MTNPEPLAHAAAPVWLISAGVLAGCLFCMLSAFGCMRMRDSYTRMHVATKSVAFGGAILVICQMLANPQPTVLVFGVLVLVFLYMTLPLAAHLLGRTIYRSGIRPIKPFVIDEAVGRISQRQVETLKPPPQPPAPPSSGG